MKSIARVEIYDYYWDNDYPDVWACQVQLTCYQTSKDSLAVQVLSISQIGQRLEQLMESVKAHIDHTDSWFWQHHFVAGYLVALSHQSDQAGIRLVPTYRGEDYPQAPEASSLWRIFVRWDRDLAEDGYFYGISSYLLTPDQNGDHIERLEAVDWRKEVEKETQL